MHTNKSITTYSVCLPVARLGSDHTTDVFDATILSLFTALVGGGDTVVIGNSSFDRLCSRECTVDPAKDAQFLHALDTRT